MKTLLATTAIAVTLTTPVHAENFDNFQNYVTAYVGDFQFTVEGTQNAGFTNLEAGYTFLTYDLSATTTARAAAYVDYDRLADAFGITGEYSMTYATGEWALYGAAALAYVAPVSDLGGGAFFATPTVGVGYVISENISTWAEVDYTWDMSNSFSRQGGELEVGMTFVVSDNITVEPSVVRTFDTGNDDTQARVGLKLWF